MEKSLKILILEDSPDDLDLIERELKRGGIIFTSIVVKKKEEYENALNMFRPEIILSDHSLPQFNSIEAMQIWKNFQEEQKVSIPFILITGSVSEEFAVQSIKAGADDYILKDRLKRLPSSIQNALQKARMEKERAKFVSAMMSQSTLMKEAEQLAHFGSWQVDLVSGVHQWSDETFRILGFTPGEIDPDYEQFLKYVHPGDKERLKNHIQVAISRHNFHEFEFRIIDKDQTEKNILCKILVKRDPQDKAFELVGFALDITKQKIQTQALELQNQKLMEIAWVQSHEVRGPLARLMGLVQLLKRYSAEKADMNVTLDHIMESANELDDIIRKIVRKTEEIV
jgi:CheY-like chemotaxis protein